MTREQRAADAVQDNVPAVVRDLHVRPRAADLADRRRAAARLHEHRPGGACSRAPSRAVIEPTAVDADAGGARHGADRGAQRLRHRRPRPHGREHARRGRPAGRLHRSASPRRTPLDAMDTRARGRRPGADEGPGRCRLRLLAGALRPRHPRRLAAVEHDRHARGDRRDRVRAAADPRLRADRARRLVQADRAGRHAARASRCSTPRAAASRPTPTGSRCGRASAAPATAATARAAAPRSTPARSSTPCRPRSCRPSAARTSRARRWRRCAPASTRARSTSKSDLVFTDIWADTTKPGVVARAVDQRQVHRQREPGRRPGHAGAGQRLHQLSAARRADLDPHPRHRRRQHLHQLPHRPGQARPARRHLPAPAASRPTRS